MGFRSSSKQFAPHVSKLEGEDFPRAGSLSPSQRDELRRVLARVRRGLRTAVEGPTDDNPASDEPGTAKATIEIVPGAHVEEDEGRLLSPDPEVNEAVLDFSTTDTRAPPQEGMPILLRSVLTMSVSASKC